MSDSEKLTTLSEFRAANPIPEDMCYRGAAEAQQVALRSAHEIARHYDRKATISVVGKHMSKSIRLPVVRIDAPRVGLRLFLRDNFFNWAISVESSSCADGEFSPPFSSGGDYDQHAVYFEGFERSCVYGSYDDSQNRFSGHVWSGDGGLFLFLVRLFDSVGHIQVADEHP